MRGGQQQLQPMLTHLCHGPQGTSVSTRRTPASSVSPVCTGAPARAPTASVPPASLAHVASKVTIPGFSLGPWGWAEYPQLSGPTDWTLPFSTGSGHGAAESDWHLEGSGGNGAYWLRPARAALPLAAGLSVPLSSHPTPLVLASMQNGSMREAHCALVDRIKKGKAMWSWALPCPHQLGDIGQGHMPL